jgi:hypothetical protein
MTLFIRHVQDRPLSDGERQLLQQVSDRYRKSVCVVGNKMDIQEDTGVNPDQTDKRASLISSRNTLADGSGLKPGGAVE